MSDTLDELYRDIVMDHFKYPRGKKVIKHPNASSDGQNPVCGDEIHVSLKINDDVIEDIGVDCAGCAISVASGSMLADVVKGKTLAEVKIIAATIRALLKGEKLPYEIELGDLEALGGVRKFPVRIKCALLAWTTLIDSIESLEQGQIKREKVSTTE